MGCRTRHSASWQCLTLLALRFPLACECRCPAAAVQRSQFTGEGTAFPLAGDERLGTRKLKRCVLCRELLGRKWIGYSMHWVQASGERPPLHRRPPVLATRDCGRVPGFGAHRRLRARRHHSPHNSGRTRHGSTRPLARRQISTPPNPFVAAYRWLPAGTIASMDAAQRFPFSNGFKILSLPYRAVAPRDS
jgi:hypothetical protein